MNVAIVVVEGILKMHGPPRKPGTDVVHSISASAKTSALPRSSSALTFSFPRVIAVSGQVHGVHTVPIVIASLTVVAVPFASGLAVSVVLIVAVVHVSISEPDVLSLTREVPGSRLKSSAVGTGHFELHGLLAVEQKTPPAEAVPAPANAIAAVAASAARPVILR